MFVSVQESSFLLWSSGRPVASSSAPFALSSTWTPSSSTPVSLIFHHRLMCFFVHVLYLILLCLSTGKLGITPDDPRWIGAWWAGFLLCGALLFCSAVLMFGFPQSLPIKEREEAADTEQVMLPPPLNSEAPKSSNGVVHNHEPANSPTCCQQLRGECARDCCTAVW